MVTWFEALFVAGSGGGLTLLAQSGTAWLKARKAAERRARAFLNRMRSIAAARGALVDTLTEPRGEAAFTDTDDGGQS